ncbi:hypothetical protein V6N13_059773 [Hibiscus sabdariffa]|uniref:Uncharacterized protein n=1 Tax=Hibiscus sabdariffa TaxID=183260 RepID=A0ABR2GDR4_9ROSI
MHSVCIIFGLSFFSCEVSLFTLSIFLLLSLDVEDAIADLSIDDDEDDLLEVDVIPPDLSISYIHYFAVSSPWLRDDEGVVCGVDTTSNSKNFRPVQPVSLSITEIMGIKSAKVVELNQNLKGNPTFGANIDSAKKSSVLGGPSGVNLPLGQTYDLKMTNVAEDSQLVHNDGLNRQRTHDNISTLSGSTGSVEVQNQLSAVLALWASREP